MVGRSAPPSSNTSKRRPRRDAVQIFSLISYIPFSLFSLVPFSYLFFNAIVLEKKKIKQTFSIFTENCHKSNKAFKCGKWEDRLWQKFHRNLCCKICEFSFIAIMITN